jgi:hypothetical protein
MTFAEEVGAYRFRLLGPRFRVDDDKRYRLPRPNGSSATVLESPQLVLETNNVDLGSVEATLKAPLRELGAITNTSSLACGAVVNAAVRHMPEDLAFVTTDVGDGFMFLAGLFGNDEKACVGIDDFGEEGDPREALRERFDARRSSRHSFFEGSHRDYFGSGAVPQIGVFLYDGDHSYEQQLEGLQVAEPFFADDCLIIVDDTNWDAPRQATLDFVRDSRLSWRVVLDERTAGKHPTLWNGLMVLQAGGGDSDSQVRFVTETRLVDPVTFRRADPPQHPPRLTVLHYRNPWVGVQDYPNLEIVGLNRGASVKEAFERSTGSYVVVLDPDVELTPDALSEAVRQAEGGGQPPRNGKGSRRHDPLAQADYSPSWAQTFDDKHEPQTVTVARALSVTRDNLVALDLDPHLDDTDREIAVRFAADCGSKGRRHAARGCPTGWWRAGSVRSSRQRAAGWSRASAPSREPGPSSRSTIAAESG